MLYAFGSNGSGQLGIGHHEDTASPEPVKFVNDQQDEISIGLVKKLAAGGNHTLVLNERGRIYVAGNNEDGRCCSEHPASFTRMQELDNDTAQSIGLIHDISATWSASFLVAADMMTVYICGSGEHGELGIGDGVTLSRQLRKLDPIGDAPIRRLSSGISHTLIVLTNGQVWGWGRGRKGQLGSHKSDQWAPQRILDVDFAASEAVAGAEFTCVLGAPDTGDVMILGSDKRDRFRLRVDIPRSVVQWTSISAAWSTVHIRLSDSSLVCWGRQDRGQIPPQDLPAIEGFAAGSEHWVALSTSGEVLAGGWGEHGNCGPIIDQDDVVKGRYNLVQIPFAATQVFAGCATSFIAAEEP